MEELMIDPSFIDYTPTFYLLMLGYLLVQIGKHFAQRYPRTANYQSGLAVLVFAYLTLPRLFYQQPYSPAEGIGIAVRAAAFAAITYGLAGFIAMGHMGIVSLLQKGKQRWQTWQSNRELREQQRIADEERRLQDSYSPSYAEMQEAARREREVQERREEEARRREEDRQRRLELKLQAELEMEFAADKNRREKLNEFINTYADESLPVDVYQQRLEMIRNAVTRNSPAKAKQYHSMQEIIDDFDKQIADVDNSTNSEFEKQSLRALILMERQNVIQRFIQP
jgi:hypothetical protein